MIAKGAKVRGCRARPTGKEGGQREGGGNRPHQRCCTALPLPFLCPRAAGHYRQHRQGSIRGALNAGPGRHLGEAGAACRCWQELGGAQACCASVLLTPATPRPSWRCLQVGTDVPQTVYQKILAAGELGLGGLMVGHGWANRAAAHRLAVLLAGLLEMAGLESHVRAPCPMLPPATDVGRRLGRCSIHLPHTAQVPKGPWALPRHCGGALLPPAS